MDPRPSLLFAGLLALPAAILADVCLPAAAAIAAAGVCVAVCSRHRLRFAGLVALPLLLAAMPVRGPAAGPKEGWPRPGPVRLTGVVEATVHVPTRDATLVYFAGLCDRAGRPLRLSCSGTLAAVPGDRITAIGNLVPGVAPGLPPTLHADAAAVRVQAAPPSLPRLLHRARLGCERALLALVPNENGPVLATLVLGRGTRAPRDVAEAHRATGLSHLLAVSGAHAAMLGFMLGLGGPGRGRRLATHRWHVTLALLLLFAYAGITGGEPPVVRAVLMYALGALAVQVGRPLRLLVGLMVPALVTAATAPAALLGPSFLLSYAAVAGLALAIDRGDGFVGRWLLTPLRASFWATCTTAPITLFWFGQVAPWTILLTPLLAPLVAVLLLFGLVAAVLTGIAPALATPLGPVLDGLTASYVAAVAAADHLPATPIRAWCQPEPPLIGLAALVALGVGASLRGRRRVAAAMAVAMLPWFAPLRRTAVPRLQLFAVGHGQAALLETARGERVAIDCGSLQVPHLAARQLVEALPVCGLDWLVVTHADQDHHNGVLQLLQRVEVVRALLPVELEASALAAALRAHGTEVFVLHGGEAARPVAGVRVAAPRLPAGASSNDRSLWATLAVGGTRVLLTGDAEALGTAAAIGQGLAAPSEILVLPHHGRPNPTAPALLRHVRPAVCLASAATVDGETALGPLVRHSGAELWCTGLHGALTIRFGEEPAVRGAAGERPVRRAVR